MRPAELIAEVMVHGISIVLTKLYTLVLTEVPEGMLATLKSLTRLALRVSHFRSPAATRPAAKRP